MSWPGRDITYYLLLLYNSIGIICLSASIQMLCIVSCLGLFQLSIGWAMEILCSVALLSKKPQDHSVVYL